MSAVARQQDTAEAAAGPATRRCAYTFGPGDSDVEPSGLKLILVKRILNRWFLERHGPCCPALSWMDSRRVAGVTCGAFGTTLLHLERDLFHSRRKRQ